MAVPTLVLAENLRLDPGIPPWMGFAMVAVWLAIVVLAVALWRWRRAARRAVRIEGRRSAATTARPAPPPDDRQLGPGNDVEVW